MPRATPSHVVIDLTKIRFVRDQILHAPYKRKAWGYALDRVKNLAWDYYEDGCR